MNVVLLSRTNGSQVGKYYLILRQVNHCIGKFVPAILVTWKTTTLGRLFGDLSVFVVVLPEAMAEYKGGQ